MNIEFKEGVSKSNLHPKVYEAIFESAKVFYQHQLMLVVTSTTEKAKNRLKNSFHYEGKAFDVRTTRIPKTIVIKLIEKLRQALLCVDRNFQIVMKDDHIHIELDDRSKANA